MRFVKTIEDSYPTTPGENEYEWTLGDAIHPKKQVSLVVEMCSDESVRDHSDLFEILGAHGTSKRVFDPTQPKPLTREDVKVGVRVVRGPDWHERLRNQDGGVGNEGVVTGLHDDSGMVWVKWDCGGKNVYRVGAKDSDDEYDLAWAKDQPMPKAVATSPQVSQPVSPPSDSVPFHSSPHEKVEASSASASKGPDKPEVDIEWSTIKIEDDEPLGEGKEKVAYSATWNGKEVALLKFREEYRHRCDPELKVFTALKNVPNLLTCHGKTKDPKDGLPCLVQEKAKGSIETFIRDCDEDDFDDRLTNIVCIEICKQICLGMQTMAQAKINHVDLAARNVMYFSLDREDPAKCKVKVSDFGMSRSNVYYGNHKTELPWRWLPVESIKRHRFSEASDVWSFGITMWEIFSCGELPYRHLGTDEELLEFLKKERLPKPLNCPDDMYEIMKLCWTKKFRDRPKFDDIATLLSKAYTEEVRQQALKEAKEKVVWTDPNFKWWGKDKTWSPGELAEEIEHIGKWNKAGANSYLSDDLGSIGGDQPIRALAHVQTLFREGGLRSAKTKDNAKISRVQMVKQVKCIRAFKDKLSRLEVRRTGNALFNCDIGDHDVQKKEVLERLMELRLPTETKRANVFLFWHGCSHSAADKICQTGAADIALTDGGYFGRGVYLSAQAEYSMGYSDGSLKNNPEEPNENGEHVMVLCAVIVGLAYPISREEDYNNINDVPEEHKADSDLDISDFHPFFPAHSPEEVHDQTRRKDKALKAPFDAHVVEISRDENYQCVKPGNPADAMEIVCKEENQVLPLFKVYYKYHE